MSSMITSIARQTARNAATLIVAGALLAAGAMAADMADTSDPTAEREFAANTPAGLVEKHDCWTGEQPADVDYPGHVVVSKGSTPIYGGQKLVDQAIAQIFEGADHGLTVHGFCR